jgi:hypothetical protein
MSINIYIALIVPIKQQNLTILFNLMWDNVNDQKKSDNNTLYVIEKSSLDGRLFVNFPHCIPRITDIHASVVSYKCLSVSVIPELIWNPRSPLDSSLRWNGITIHHTSRYIRDTTLGFQRAQKGILSDDEARFFEYRLFGRWCRTKIK